MSTSECPPSATLILTRLQFADWDTSTIYRLKWYVARACFGKHTHGVDSHLCIRFQNRTLAMMTAEADKVSSKDAAQSTDVVWEITQRGKSGFRTTKEAWSSQFTTATNFTYEFTDQDADFVVSMHAACVDLVRGGIEYGSNLAFNAVFCRRYPYHCCEDRNSVNCVTAVLLAIAAGSVRDPPIAANYEWDEAQVAIGSDLIFAAYTPHEAVLALISSGMLSLRKPKYSLLPSLIITRT